MPIDLLSILSSSGTSLAAHRAAVAVASHNIDNASTPGYARQRADLVAVAAGDAGSGGFIGFRRPPRQRDAGEGPLPRVPDPRLAGRSLPVLGGGRRARGRVGPRPPGHRRPRGRDLELLLLPPGPEPERGQHHAPPGRHLLGPVAHARIPPGGRLPRAGQERPRRAGPGSGRGREPARQGGGGAERRHPLRARHRRRAQRPPRRPAEGARPARRDRRRRPRARRKRRRQRHARWRGRAGHRHPGGKPGDDPRPDQQRPPLHPRRPSGELERDPRVRRGAGRRDRRIPRRTRRRARHCGPEDSTGSPSTWPAP